MKFQLLPGVLLVLVFLTSVVAYPQQKNFDFEKINAADFSTVKTKDTSAIAEVVADIGYTRFDYGPKGFYLIFERKTRIHILKQDGTSHATIEIPLYKGNNDKETVTSFKGFTYNLEKGEVVKTKARNEDMFLQQQSEHWDVQKVAMPAVKANSIIEYEYQIHSDFTFNLQPWTFQSDIPVFWSEYNTKIPNYFTYKLISQGYVPFAINEKSTSNQKFTVYYESKLGVGMNQSREPGHTEVYDVDVNISRWVATEVPALKPEPFITTTNDYVSKIEFELSVIKMPGSVDETVMDSWETLNKKLLENDNFGGTVKKGDFFSSYLPAVTAKSTSDVERVKAIYDHVRSRMKWNGNNDIFANNPPKKVYDERTGSAADINLMLVAILKKAGLKAEPVILSTRSHGRVLEIYPILAKFNYVVAMVTIDSNTYLLDATTGHLPFNMLPERCLNGQGRVISKNAPGWVRLLNTEIKNTYTQVDLTLSDDGLMKGKCAISSSGLDGFDRRESYLTKNEKDFLEEFTDDHQTWTVSEFHIANLDTLDKPFTESYTIEIPDEAQLAGDRMYLNIMSGFGQETNPFKLEKRVYPVDFSCPLREYYVIKLTLPAGWVVEQLPQQATVSLPDKAGSFKCRFLETAGVIQISSTLSINKNMFLPDEYNQLKEFFRLIVAKHAEQIVLKKA